MVLLALRMVADVTETRNVIPSLELKTCMIIKSQVYAWVLIVTEDSCPYRPISDLMADGYYSSTV